MSTYTVTLRPLPSNVPEVVRLRHALKTLLRAHKLRAVDVREVTDDEDRDNRNASEQDKRSDVAPMRTPEVTSNARALQTEALATKGNRYANLS